MKIDQHLASTRVHITAHRFGAILSAIGITACVISGFWLLALHDTQEAVEQNARGTKYHAPWPVFARIESASNRASIFLSFVKTGISGWFGLVTSCAGVAVGVFSCTKRRTIQSDFAIVAGVAGPLGLLALAYFLVLR